MDTLQTVRGLLQKSATDPLTTEEILALVIENEADDCYPAWHDGIESRNAFCKALANLIEENSETSIQDRVATAVECAVDQERYG